MSYIGGTGPLGAKVMIVGESPYPSDLQSGLPFTGLPAKELTSALDLAGVRLSDCWRTYVCKVPVQPARWEPKIPFSVRAKQSNVNLDEHVEALQVEVNQVDPNVIIALGSTALWALTGKKDISLNRGSIFLGMGRKVVPTYNPYHLQHVPGSEIKGYWNKLVIRFDIKRAIEESYSKELIRPERNLKICKSVLELEAFKQKNEARGRTRLSVDIEAGGHCLPICMGLAFTPSEGLTIPLWNKGGISNLSDTELVSIWTILADMLWENDIVGQNFTYDTDKIKRLGFVIRNLASDTMLKSFCISPELPKRLSFNTSLYTREPFYKDEGMYEGSIESLLIGCARDACVTLEVDQNMDADVDALGLREFYENFIMKLPSLYGDIQETGFAVDSEVRDKLIAKYVKWDEELRYELFQRCGAIINVASPKQIAILLYENFKLPRKKGTGEEQLTLLLNSPKVSEEHKHIIKLILENRRVRKTIGTYLMALPDYDGRMRTTYFPCLETGRTSTGQQDPPIRPKIEVLDENGKKKKRVMGAAFQVFTKHGDIGQDVRTQFVADPGHIFIGGDLSQAEARVIAVLAGDEEMLRLYDNHDVHALTASWFFGGTESDYSKRVLGYEVPTRFVGKTLRHAGHLGASERRAALSVNTDARKYHIDITITTREAKDALDIFHAKSPSIRKVFHQGVIDALQKDRKLIAPAIAGMKSPIGGIRTFYERWGDDMFRTAFSYIPQRTVSDCCKLAALGIKRRIPGIKTIVEAHDGLLFSVPEESLKPAARIIKEEMEREIDFRSCSLSRDFILTIPCELETGYNYKDLKDYQL